MKLSVPVHLVFKAQVLSTLRTGYPLVLPRRVGTENCRGDASTRSESLYAMGGSVLGDTRRRGETVQHRRI